MKHIKIVRSSIAALLLAGAALLFCGCYSVFSGGTGGRVVDAESTSDPKAGIADVAVYAYVSEKDRNKDFDSWDGGGGFTPAAKYYAKTLTGSDGNFTISKLMWKAMFPDYWRDGDVTVAYLLFYKDDYGLVKGETILLSDSSTNTVYQELTAIKKTTALTLNVKDVATNANTGKTVQVEVSVPQAWGGNTGAAAKVYKAMVTGTGVVRVTYPRYSDADKTTANKPEVSVTFKESASEESFKMCKNGDGPTGKEYAFDPAAQTATVGGDSYTMDVWGKKCIIDVSVSGQYTKNKAATPSTPEADDGIVVSLKDGATEVDTVTTGPVNIGNGAMTHGNFTGLGSRYVWKVDNYDEQILEKTLTVSAADDTSKFVKVTSAQPSTYVNLQ